MSEAADWAEIAQNIRNELKNESARRAALTAAGQPPPITYSAGGRSVSYTEWCKSMIEAAKEAEQRAQDMDPFEIHEHGY